MNISRFLGLTFLGICSVIAPVIAQSQRVPQTIDELVKVLKERRQREAQEQQERIEQQRSQGISEQQIQRGRLEEERQAKVLEEQRMGMSTLQSERKRREEAEEKLSKLRQEVQGPPVPAVPFVMGRRVALVIGNAQYKQSPLDTPVNDARDVAAALRALGFETQEVLNANKSQMMEATRNFERKASASDTALIYFAGHGIEFKGKNYMIPVGVNILRDYELPAQAYDTDQWLDMLEGIRETNTKRVNIVILDACRNNEMTRGWRSSGSGLAQMQAPVGTFIAYSTAPGKRAPAGEPGDRNSPFTRHLLSSIRQPNIPIYKVFQLVRSAVIADTNAYSDRA